MTTLLRGTAFITGAGSGIGQAVAWSFAKYGVKNLAIADIRKDGLQDTIDGLKKKFPDVNCEPIEMDASSETDINKAVDHVVKKFGRLDIAMNNAGGGGPIAPSAEVELADWKKLMDLNLNGVWLCQRAELRQMLKQEVLEEREGRGTIINTASMYGLIGNTPLIPATAYASSKHAVMGLTKTDALYYAKEKIRVNAICPGYTLTPIMKNVIASGAMTPEIEKTPMGRFATPEEIADCVTFLASPMSSYVTGTGLVADGGFVAQ